MSIKMQQPPVRNEIVVGAQVYSHSGEFAPQVIDMVLPGRGLSFQFIRKYRSALSGQIGQLGRGWTFNYAKRLEETDDGILYHDGMGSIHQFMRVDQNKFSSPEGFYSILYREGNTFILHQRFGTRFYFEHAKMGGRLLRIQDRNENQIKFKYEANGLQISDSFDRKITLKFESDRLVGLRDHTGRLWSYRYNSDNCLIEVIQPATLDFPDGTRVQYSYDDNFRLQTITDPRGQAFLENKYDDNDRVKSQRHGNGFIRFTYEPIEKGSGDAPLYQTQVEQKNGGRLLLIHNANGQVVERTLFVSAESLSEGDRNGGELTVPLTTKSLYNHHGEIIACFFPAGNSSEWTYDENNPDSLQQGNLLRVTRRPADNVEGDQKQLITTLTYENQFQRRKTITEPHGQTTSFEYDDRGNLISRSYPPVTVQPIDPNGSRPAPEVRKLVERFEYNKGGQVLRSIDSGGAATEYHYSLSNRLAGKRKGRAKKDSVQADGYLEKIIVDAKKAKVSRRFSYDDYGNVTAVYDGKNNATRWRYNEHGHVISTISRKPFNHEITIRYDANDNPIESEMSFEYSGYDSIDEAVVLRKSTLRQVTDYNTLNNIVQRRLQSEGKTIVETFERDADENVIRRIQPLGNRTEYRFDERNCLLERKQGAGTDIEVVERYTYTRNGRRRTHVDGRGETVHYDYDGFHRYRGFTNPGGTSKRQWLDAAGNVVRLEVTGSLGLANENKDSFGGDSSVASLVATTYQYDELNRRVRVDRAWRDPATGKNLGKSLWDGESGIASAITEYGDNHLPSRVWLETGNIVSLNYDGANRIVSATDSTGELVTIEYDKNNNPVHLLHLGPEVEGDERFEQDIALKYDALDRPIERSINYESPDGLTYNSLGAVASYANRAGAELRYIYDALGRSIGQFQSVKKKGKKQYDIINNIELDDNSRVIAQTDAGRQRTEFRYDALNRHAGIVYADGNTKTFQRDGKGNLIRIVDEKRNQVDQKFDARGNLTERRIRVADGGGDKIERFQYDGLNRIVAAQTDTALISRRFDTLSRLLEEDQAGLIIQYGYDTAGNRTRIAYPGGQEVVKTYDPLRRVSEVKDSLGGTVARYRYRSGNRLREQFLGDALQATFAYKECQSCLSEIVYKTPKGDLVEGSRYQYDLAGNQTQEILLNQGEKAGERYFYDSASRLVSVQYGVKNVNDPKSAFREEVQYELTPIGTWQQKRALNSQGKIIKRVNGMTNQRHAYLSLGKEVFAYDANGNCISKTAEDGTICRYFYDYADRLIRIECYDASGKLTQTIEYSYDAFGRQISKVVTDADGQQTEYRFVWNGRQLIEQYENGNLSVSYVYGAFTARPDKLTKHTPHGTEDFFYTYNCRGQVTSLVGRQGVLERYRYDALGLPSVVEIGGKTIPIGKQNSASSVGDLFAGLGVGRTWDNNAGLWASFGHFYDPSTGQLINNEDGRGGELSFIPSGGTTQLSNGGPSAKSSSNEEHIFWHMAGPLTTVLIGAAGVAVATTPVGLALGVLAIFGGVGWGVADVETLLNENKSPAVGGGTPDSGTPDGGTPEGGTPEGDTPGSDTLPGGTPDSGSPEGNQPVDDPNDSEDAMTAPNADEEYGYPEIDAAKFPRSGFTDPPQAGDDMDLSGSGGGQPRSGSGPDYGPDSSLNAIEPPGYSGIRIPGGGYTDPPQEDGESTNNPYRNPTPVPTGPVPTGGTYGTGSGNQTTYGPTSSRF